MTSLSPSACPLCISSRLFSGHFSTESAAFVTSYFVFLSCRIYLSVCPLFSLTYSISHFVTNENLLIGRQHRRAAHTASTYRSCSNLSHKDLDDWGFLRSFSFDFQRMWHSSFHFLTTYYVRWRLWMITIDERVYCYAIIENVCSLEKCRAHSYYTFGSRATKNAIKKWTLSNCFEQRSCLVAGQSREFKLTCSSLVTLT